MSVFRDDKTRRWMFRGVVRFADGRRARMSGTPAAPGLYQDLANTKEGALAAESRCKLLALTGKLYVDGTPIEAAPPPRAEVPTLREYAGTFTAFYRPGSKPSHLASNRQIVYGHLVPAFGDLRLDQIRQADVDAFAKAELRRCAAKTVNNRLAVLSSLLRYAAENGAAPPSALRCFVDGGDRPNDGEIAAVPDADVERLVAAAADPFLRVAVLLASDAGLRNGELRALQHGDLRDGEARIVRAFDVRDNLGLPKHSKRRVVPLTARLAAELEALPRRGLWVLARPDGEHLGYYASRDTLRALYVAAGVEVPRTGDGATMPWHSLRHSFGTRCHDRGVPIGVVQELMGHADIKTTRRYFTVTPAAKRDAIAAAFDRPASRLPVRAAKKVQRGEK